jgi:hypothetical protein
LPIEADLLLTYVLSLQISQLHPPALEFAQEDAAADVAHSSKMNQLIRAKDGAAAQESSLQQLAEQGDTLPMAFGWSSVIWTLALNHKNLQVRGKHRKHKERTSFDIFRVLCTEPWSPPGLAITTQGPTSSSLLAAALLTSRRSSAWLSRRF